MWRNALTIAFDTGMRFVRYNLLAYVVLFYLTLALFLLMGIILIIVSLVGMDPLSTIGKMIFPNGFSYSSDGIDVIAPVVNAVLLTSFVVASLRSLLGAEPSTKLPTKLFWILTLMGASGSIILSIGSQDPRFLLALTILVPASGAYWAYVGLCAFHRAARNMIVHGELTVIKP